MADRFQVKGSSIRTKLVFARDRFGAEAEQALVNRLADLGVTRVLEGGWYDFEIYNAVLGELARVGYDGHLDGLREAGAFSATQALSTTYQAFAKHRDLERFLALIPRFHLSLHTHGTLVIDGPKDGILRFTLSDLPQTSRADQRVTEGFYLGAVRLLGWPDATSEPTPREGGIEVTITENASPVEADRG